MKKLTSLTLALIMALSLCACGSAKSGAAVTEDSYNGAASYATYAAEAPMAAPAAAYDTAAGLASTANYKVAGEVAEAEGADAPEVDPDKIIYSADVTVETTEFEDGLASLEALIEKNGGWVQSSSVNGANYYSQSRGYSSTRSADYTVRVPSDRFSALMTSLSDIGNVPYTHTYTENVTSQYYDAQARLTAYKTQETTLLAMMEKAETVSDVITIEDRLTELRYQIESIQSTLNNWDRQVSYSTVYISLQEVEEYTPEKETRVSYGRELWLALTGALRNTGAFFKNLLVFIVSILPALVILAVLFFVFRPLLRRLSAKRKAKRAEKQEKKAATDKGEAKE